MVASELLLELGCTRTQLERRKDNLIVFARIYWIAGGTVYRTVSSGAASNAASTTGGGSGSPGSSDAFRAGAVAKGKRDSRHEVPC